MQKIMAEESFKSFHGFLSRLLFEKEFDSQKL